MTYRRTKEEVAEALAEHEYLRSAGGFAMRHTLVSMYSSATGMRSPETVVRGGWAAADDGFAGERLLLNYRTAAGDLGFQSGVSLFFEPDAITAAAHADLEEELSAAVGLPAPKRIRTGLTAVVTTRRSGRQFSGKAVSIVDMATVLHHAQGICGELVVQEQSGRRGTVKLRTAPSAGGLYPVALFVEAFNVTDLAPGSYQYLPHAHALRPVPAAVDGPALFQSPDFDYGDCGFAVTFVYSLLHNSRKYGDSGVVFGLIEVGAILQNLHLARAALALAGCDQGGYDKQGIEEAYGLDGLSRHVVHVTAIGQEG